MTKATRYLLAIALVCCATQRASADNGAPSSDILSSMGLSGLQVMSDGEALAIRGHGYKGSRSQAVAYGRSWASVPGGGSENGYFAKGKRFAKGENFSYAAPHRRHHQKEEAWEEGWRKEGRRR